MPRFPKFQPESTASANRLTVLTGEVAPISTISTLAVATPGVPEAAGPAVSTVSTLAASAPADGTTLESIMAIPLRPCTTCANLNWHDREFIKDDGTVRAYRSRECDHYSKRIAKDQAVKCCRCVHHIPRYT